MKNIKISYKYEVKNAHKMQQKKFQLPFLFLHAIEVFNAFLKFLIFQNQCK